MKKVLGFFVLIAFVFSSCATVQINHAQELQPKLTVYPFGILGKKAAEIEGAEEETTSSSWINSWWFDAACGAGSIALVSWAIYDFTKNPERWK